MEEYIIYQSKGKRIGILVLCCIMVIVSLFIAFMDILENKMVGLAIGAVGVLFFGWALFFNLKKLTGSKGEPIIVMTSQGFHDYSSALATKDMLIQWDNVKKVENTSMLNQKFVSVYLKEPSKVLNKLNKIQLNAVKANMKMGYGEINITLQSAKNCTNEELASRMNEYLINK